MVPLGTGPSRVSDWALPLPLVFPLWSCVSLSDSSAFSRSDLSEKASFSREDPFSLEGHSAPGVPPGQRHGPDAPSP